MENEWNQTWILLNFSLYFNIIIEKKTKLKSGLTKYELVPFVLQHEYWKKAKLKSGPTKYRVCTSFNANIEKIQITLETSAICPHSI